MSEYINDLPESQKKRAEKEWFCKQKLHSHLVKIAKSIEVCGCVHVYFGGVYDEAPAIARRMGASTFFQLDRQIF